MGRKRRIHVPNAIVHVTQKCHDSAMLLMDDEDKAMYLEILQEVARGMEYDIVSYCIQDNHTHQVLETPSEIESHTLSEFMFRVNNTFSHRFNARHNRTGSVWNGRYKDTGWFTREQLVALEILLWYVEGNTARRRHQPVQPAEWPWCSAYWVFRNLVGPVRTRLKHYLDVLYRARGDPLAQFRQLLEQQQPEWAKRARQSRFLKLGRRVERILQHDLKWVAEQCRDNRSRNWKLDVTRYSMLAQPVIQLTL